MALQGLRHIQSIWPRKVGEGAPTSTPDSNARTLSETTPVRVEYSPACQKLRSNGHGRSRFFPKAKAASGGSSATSLILEGEDGSLLALIVGRYRELCCFLFNCHRRILTTNLKKRRSENGAKKALRAGICYVNSRAPHPRMRHSAPKKHT